MRKRFSKELRIQSSGMNNLFNNIKIKFDYWKNDELLRTTFVGNFTHQDFTATLSLSHDQNVEKLKLTLEPHEALTIHSLMIESEHQFQKDDRLYVNGYQSWTDSKECFTHEKMKHLSKLASPLLKKYQFDKYGDYSFKKYSNRAGDFHGYTYGYIRQENDFHLLGSLSEKNGFTIINFSAKECLIWIAKDCKGLSINQPYEAFNLISIMGCEKDVFDQYFEKMKIAKPKAKAMSGWTSWYNYYENINEEIIFKNLDALKKANKSIDIFQIDDGYQTHVGDWLDVDEAKFPHGMKFVADRIRFNGYKAGLWLAPFVCETDSKITAEHRDWILKDDQGELVLAGSNWSRFYALDIENLEVRTYIKKVFDTVLNSWGYDLVKLDFLYAVCLIPNKNKTRGQIMSEAMVFLRECIGDKLILACGVPLGPSFGLVDYCRIGCDVGLDWDDKPFMRLLHRERVSTLNALHNAIGRWHLNGRAFMNDPDVFFLREDNIKLTLGQKETIAFVNKLFGRLIFTSDDITQYNAYQHELFDRAMNLDHETIQNIITHQSGLIEVTYTHHEKSYKALLNFSKKAVEGINPFETSIHESKEVK